jgi:prevent-host-death family protein
MFITNGIEAIATITELRSKTSELVNRAHDVTTGIMIQKNNEPYAVLISYDRYIDLIQAEKKRKG